MSSISSLSSAIQQSPKQRILDAISSGVGTGSIDSTDQTALDSAVDDIDTSLTSSRSTTSGKPDPSDIKTKIDGLIDNEVTNGKLTSDQASTLKQVFSQSAGHHTHGAGGHGAAGGPPPGPPPSDGADSSSSSSDSSSSGSTSTDANDLVASFLKELQSSQNTTSGYGATGTSGATGTTNSLIFNFSA